MSGRFGYDAAVPLDVEGTGDITYDDGAGGRARATLLVPPRPTGTAVILAHGGSDDGRHHFLGEATDLVARGFVALLPVTTFPPHGDERATAAAIRLSVLVHRRGLDVLSGLADRFCFFGHSGGAFQGAFLSAVEPRLTALALASAGSGTLPRLAAAQPGVGPSYLRFLDGYDPAPYVAVPGRRRLLFQHGRDDTSVLRPEAVRLFEAAAGPKEWREYPCGHDTASPPAAREDRLRLFTS